MLDGLGDHATGDHRLPKTDLVRDKEAVRGVLIEVQTAEGVVNRSTLKGL
jgi:hypothetical protein